MCRGGGTQWWGGVGTQWWCAWCGWHKDNGVVVPGDPVGGWISGRSIEVKWGLAPREVSVGVNEPRQLVRTSGNGWVFGWDVVGGAFGVAWGDANVIWIRSHGVDVVVHEVGVDVIVAVFVVGVGVVLHGGL